MIRYKLDYSQNPGRRPSSYSYALREKSAPLVSIVTPVYNEKKIHLEELKNSILGQSFQQFEWLIVDDCSTETETVEFLTNLANADIRIHYIRHQRNMGLPTTRNTGINASVTQFVVLIDSDDVLEPTSIEKMFWKLLTDENPMFCTGYSVGFGAEEYYWTHGFHDGAAMLEDNWVTIQGVMFRKELFSKGICFKEEMRQGLEDWHLWLQCANKGYWGVTIPEAFDWYRRKPNHEERWKNWKNKDQIHASFKREFAGLWQQDSFPVIDSPVYPFGESAPCLNSVNCLKKDKQRLLMIVPWLVVGGADMFNLMAIRALKEKGWEISIVTTKPTEHIWRSEFYELTSDIFILENFINPWDYPRFLHYLITSRNHDAIMITNSELGCRLMPYLRYHFPHKAFINYTHIEEEYWRNGGHPRFAVMYQPLFQSLYVASQHLKKWMCAQGAAEEHIKVCYINVDTEKWRPDAAVRAEIRRGFGIADDLPVILFAGRVCQQKQPDVLIRVLENIERSGWDFLALIAGEGEELPRIQQYAKEHELHNIHFLGQVANETVRRYMQAADVFFLPSLMEGISLAIYEAMSTGLAVVGADVGGQNELVNEETGILLPRSCPEKEIYGYSAALAYLMENPHIMHRMGQKAHNLLHSRFSLTRLGENLDSLLQNDIANAQIDVRGNIDEFFARNSALLAIDWFISDQYTADIYQKMSSKGNS